MAVRRRSGPRSARGGGSRRERRPGVWEIRVTVGVDPATGASKQQSFTHRGDQASATVRQRELMTLYGGCGKPAAPTSAHMTVRELMDAFVSSEHRWSPTTWRTHTGHARLLCRDRLGRARLDRMTHNAVERAIARWVRAGETPATISAWFRILHAAISWAIRNKLIVDDPLEGMRTPAQPYQRMHLRPGQVMLLVRTADAAVGQARARFEARPDGKQAMLDLFRAEQNALLVRLVSDCAARRGELVALRTTDLRGRVLGMRRASQDGVIVSIKRGHMTLAVGTARYWKEHVRRWEQYLPADDAAGPRWLFRARPDRTTPLLPNGLGQRFDKLADTAGVGDASLHRIRHTVGTYLVAQGKIMQASARLRHRDMSTTLRVYAHVLPLDDEEIADGLAELYGLATPDTASEEHTSPLDIMGGW